MALLEYATSENAVYVSHVHLARLPGLRDTDATPRGDLRGGEAHHRLATCTARTLRTLQFRFKVLLVVQLCGLTALRRIERTRRHRSEVHLKQKL